MVCSSLGQWTQDPCLSRSRLDEFCYYSLSPEVKWPRKAEPLAGHRQWVWPLNSSPASRDVKPTLPGELWSSDLSTELL